jgi:hypothetical protein
LKDKIKKIIIKKRKNDENITITIIIINVILVHINSKLCELTLIFTIITSIE